MASIRKKAGSKFWFAAYYREDGTRTQTSTKTTDRKEALRIANDLEGAHQRKATEGQMRRILSDLNERLVGQPLASATLQKYAETWLVRKSGEVERVSYLAYKGAVDEFVELTPQKAHLGLQYVTPADIASYRDKCAAKSSPQTANKKLKILRVLFQTAWRDGFITENCAAKVEGLATDDSARRPFTLSEIKKVLAVANAEWRGMVLMGLYCGQRLKDVASLKWSNVELPKKLISLKTSKTGRNQEIPIAAPLVSYLSTLPRPSADDAPVFPDAFKCLEKDGHVSRLSQQFYEILVSAKLATERLPKRKSKGVGREGKRERSQISFHCLRHTATSLLKNAGVSEAVTRDIIGHDSVAMSNHYTHIETESKRAALDLLPDVTGEAESK